MNIVKSTCLAVAAFCGIMLSAAEIQIVKAEYGAGDKVIDVTEIVKEKATGFPGVFLTITPTNELFGKDPIPGKSKELTVTYTEDGQEKTAKLVERQMGVIAAGMIPAQEFKILRAFYGAKDKWNDVSEKVEKIHTDGGEATVNNASFGPDPMRGTTKSLVIIYTKDNALKALTVGEARKFSADQLKK